MSCCCCSFVCPAPCDPDPLCNAITYTWCNVWCQKCKQYIFSYTFYNVGIIIYSSVEISWYGKYKDANLVCLFRLNDSYSPSQQLCSCQDCQFTLFSWASLTKWLTTYFLHILSLVTNNNPSWISGREENCRRNYSMINLQESMGPGQDQTGDPWICVQTHMLLTVLRSQVNLPAHPVLSATL